MDWASVAKAGLWLVIAGVVLFILWRIKRAGRTEAELDAAKDTIEEVGDAADVRHTIDAATPDERQRLRDKWARRRLPDP
jgi:hypothetical protein